ncbi:transporter [Bradyrhizobium cosmicum]|uniref:SphA family protein n=1 Tax=Bradyrhizobium cosmicum TaxID=1404864 RepID=UPI0028F0C644|nr:transporter [Bradyrhizobium cosmicum]
MRLASSNIYRTAFAAAVALALQSEVTRADENGVSLWLPGQFGSLAAAPAVPGWSLGTIAYHTSVEASGNVAAARQISIGQVPATANVNLNANLNARGDLLFIAPTYTFGTPVLGGQLAVGVIGVVGNLDTSIAGTLTAQIGPIVATRSGVLSDSFTGVGDLYPLVTLKWNQGVHNYMVYGFGDIPVGAYDSTRLSNIGIGHGGIDFGAGYTYLNPTTGIEFSGVGGFTYNFKNPTTQYQNGIDFHFDWGASHFLSKQLFVGMVGYAYQQITDDTGAAPFLNGFKSRVFGFGPQAGYLFPIGDKQGYLNLKGYREFAAENRPEGWNVWLTFAISNAAPTSTVAPTRHSIGK